MSRRAMRRGACAAVLLLSGCDSSVDLAPAARPVRVYAVSSEGSMLVYWDAVPGATGYRVFAGAKGEPDGSRTQETELAEADVAFDGLTEMYVSVAALRGNDQSRRSPEIPGFPQPQYLSTQALAVVVTTAGFGSAIASAGDVDGDGDEDVLVGAPGFGSGAGAFYLLRGAPGGLDGVRLVAAGTPGSELGTSIAYSEDFHPGAPVAVVGAPGVGGAAHVYARTSSPQAFEHLFPLPAPPGSTAGRFGQVVVAAGNLDGRVPVNGEIAIAAPDAAGGAGRVYVFEGGVPADADGTADPVRVVEVSSPVATASAAFGFSMAAAGNLLTDPADDLLIGAPHHASFGAAGVLFGSLAMFQSTAATAELVAFGSSPDALFGWSITSIGDPDSDDRDEFAVGAPNDDCGSESREGKGAVMVVNFDASGDDYGIACGELANTGFGSSLAFAGNIIADEEQFLVGSYSSSGGMGGFSLAFSQFEPSETPPDSPYQFAHPTFQSEGYGRVLTTADVNGDGRPDVLVGVPEQKGVHVFVTIPANGPEVLLGGPIDAVEGLPVTFGAAFVNDAAVTTYTCIVDWGDGEGEAYPCTADDVRPDAHPYTITEPEPGGYQDFFPVLRVSAFDGRSGAAVTRVRVWPAE